MKRFSFDPIEQEVINKENSTKKERKPRVYKVYKNRTLTPKEIKEYNQPKEQFFILPSGEHVKSIFVSGLGKGIVKLSIDKVIADIKYVDKEFAKDVKLINKRR